MSSSFSAGGFGGRMDPEAMWQAFEQLRSTFEKKVGTRMGRGDVRAAQGHVGGRSRRRRVPTSAASR